MTVWANYFNLQLNSTCSRAGCTIFPTQPKCIILKDIFHHKTFSLSGKPSHYVPFDINSELLDLKGCSRYK